MAITASRMRQALGVAKTGRRYLAPKPNKKKNTKDAVAAPLANRISCPGNRVEIVPISTTVSR